MRAAERGILDRQRDVVDAWRGGRAAEDVAREGQTVRDAGGGEDGVGPAAAGDDDRRTVQIVGRPGRRSGHGRGRGEGRVADDQRDGGGRGRAAGVAGGDEEAVGAAIEGGGRVADRARGVDADGAAALGDRRDELETRGRAGGGRGDAEIDRRRAPRIVGDDAVIGRVCDHRRRRVDVEDVAALEHDLRRSRAIAHLNGQRKGPRGGRRAREDAVFGHRHSVGKIGGREPIGRIAAGNEDRLAVEYAGGRPGQIFGQVDELRRTDEHRGVHLGLSPAAVGDANAEV